MKNYHSYCGERFVWARNMIMYISDSRVHISYDQCVKPPLEEASLDTKEVPPDLVSSSEELESGLHLGKFSNSDDANEMNNASPVLTSSEMRSVMKSMRDYIPMDGIEEFVTKLVPEPKGIDNAIEKVVDARKINLEVDNYDFQKLLDSHNKQLTIDEVIA
ncbi:hypothetical protein TNCV_2718641 [Trichonephila clavipes]|nr:hypothetical protein TNCV_2718641 [Trichonephila clavipes]